MAYQEGGRMPEAMPLLPSVMGGETVLENMRPMLNMEANRKRSADQMAGKADLNPESKMLRVDVMKEQPVAKSEVLFTTYEEIGTQKVKADPVQSRPDEGIYAFQALPAQNQFSNPSQWKLKIRMRIDRNDNQQPYDNPEEARDHVEADPLANPAILEAAGTFHVRLANRAQAYLFKKIEVVFNQTTDINTTYEFQSLQEYMTWALNNTVEEKDDMKSRYEQMCHSSLAGDGVERVGVVRANNALQLSADMPKQEWGGRECEEILYKLQNDNAHAGNAGAGFDLVIGPIPGPFFMLNRFLPGSFVPKIVFHLNVAQAELAQWLIVKEATPRGRQGGQRPAGVAVPRCTIMEPYTELLVPYKVMEENTAKAEERKFFFHQREPYTTEKMIRIYASNTFNTQNNDGGEGQDLDPFPALRGRVPDQFGFGFITDGLARGAGRDLNGEKVRFERNNITRLQIYLGEDPIFQDGPLDWRDTDKNNQRLWQMQCDYWGNEDNEERKNAVCQDPDDMPYGQKWVWCSLNPNYNGGMQVIERIDKEFKVRVWGDGVTNNVRFVLFIPEGVNYVCNDAVANDWVGPEYPVRPAYNVVRPVCYNQRGGRRWT